MSNLVVVDDFRANVATGTPLPQVLYNPANWWRSNAACDGCDVENDVASSLLRSTANDGTWTAAGYQREWPVLSATLDFQGTNVAVYMIFFIRVLDPRSTGPANLTFYVDGAIRSTRSVRPEDYTFNSNNFTPRMQVFQAPDLDPNTLHSLRIQWTHGGVTRPAVVVALDSIEFNAAIVSGNGTVTSTSPASPTRSTTTKILVGVLVPVVALLALAVGFLVWKRRRRMSELEINPPNSAVPSEVPSYLLSQHHQIRPFNFSSRTGIETPFTVQTEDTPSTSPVSGSLGVHPPSYLESLQSPVGRFAPIVKSSR